MTRFLLNITRLLEIDMAKLEAVSAQVHQILGDIVGPCLSVIGSIGVIYMIVMGVQYAKSESDEKRAEFKTRMINLAIGIIIIFILVAMCLAINWAALVKEVFSYFSDASIES